MSDETLVPRWVIRVLLPLSLVAALALALLVRSVFTGVFLDLPEKAVATPSPPDPFPAPARPRTPTSPPRPVLEAEGGPRGDEPPEASAEAPPPRRTLWRRHAEPETVVSARLRVRREQVRRLQGRYRELEREVRAQGGIESAQAQDALRELERTARELRRAEADLDRARRREGR